MKKLAFVFIAVILYGDVVGVINEIKKMQYYKPHFKQLEKYSVFGNFEIQKNEVTENTALPYQEDLTLNVIFQNKANINGIWVKAGDVIEGYKVIKIKDNEVVLKKDNKILKLKLKTNYLKVVK